MIRCPFCNKKFNIIEAIIDEEWRTIIALLPTFERHEKLVFEYVEKFGVHPLKIKSNKILRLLRQMEKLFVTSSFTWRGHTKKISKTGIVSALEIVNNKHFDMPLENHNYLKKVMLGIADHEEKEKSRQVEKELRDLEAKGRGVSSRQCGFDDNEDETMSTREFQERIGKLADQIKDVEDLTKNP